MKTKWLIVGVAVLGSMVLTTVIVGTIGIGMGVERFVLAPRRAAPLVQLAYTQMNQGQYDQAIRTYTEAIRLDPHDEMSFVCRGYCYGGKGDWSHALEDYTEAIRLNSRDATAYSHRGSAYLWLEEWDKAIADLNRAIRLDAKEASSYANRAYAHQGKGEHDKAISDYSTAIRLDPQDPTSFEHRGQLREQMRDWNKAVADYAKAVAVGSTNEYTLNSFAWIRATHPVESLRDGKAAISLAKRACDLTAWKEWHYVDTLAAAYAEAGDFEQAVKYQKQCLEMPNVSSESRREIQERLSLFEQQKPYRQPTN